MKRKTIVFLFLLQMMMLSACGKAADETPVETDNTQTEQAESVEEDITVAEEEEQDREEIDMTQEEQEQRSRVLIAYFSQPTNMEGISMTDGFMTMQEKGVSKL